MKLRKCKHCGYEMSAGAKFCPQCGAPSACSPSQKRPLILAALAVLAVLVVVAAAAMLYRAKSASTFPSTSMEETQIQAGSGTLYVPDSDSFATDENTGISYVNNIVLIFFEPDSEQEQINKVITSTGGTVVGSLPVINQYQVQVTASSLPELQALCERLNEMDGVVQASYDPVVPTESNRTSNDPWPDVEKAKGDNWWSPLTNIFQRQEVKDKTWWLDAVDAQEAWEYNDRLSPVRIGIIDCGFDVNHEDLKNKIHFVNSFNIPDSHGTRCAGIIGAEADNSLGMAGLVWNGDLDLWDLSLVEEQKEQLQGKGGPNYISMNMIFGGTVSLIEDGCKVINLSNGQTGNYTMHTDKKTGAKKYRLNSDLDMTMEEWAQYYSSCGYSKTISYYLLPLLEDGYDFVLVQSAGNGDSNHVSIDASMNGWFTWVTLNKDDIVHSEHYSSVDLYNRIIIVGSAQPDDNGGYIQASDSNAGSRVDICAPGADIYSTDLNNSYTFDSGTSFAAPIVSGIAGLVWAADPDLTGEQIKSILCYEDTHTDIVGDNTKKSHPLVNSYPLVNAEKCVEAALDKKGDSNTSEKNEDLLAGTEPKQDRTWLLATESVYSPDMDLRSQTSYEYTPDGNLSASVENSGTTRTECTYDANENPVQENVYDEDGLLDATTRQFDEYGNVILETATAVWDQAYNGFTYEYTYNEDNRIVNAKCYSGGQLYTDTTYTYSDTGHTEEIYCYLIAEAHTKSSFDQNGKLIKKINYLDDGSTQEYQYSYEYRYDEHGNVAECRNYEDNSLTLITQYTYKLFDRNSSQSSTEQSIKPDPIPTGTDFEYLESCIRYQGRFYKIEEVTVPWSGAKAACESKGGHLATITSQEEQEFIQSLNANNLCLWIGGHRDTDGNWCWITGEPWDYTHWGDGEPNNSSNVVAGETCAALWPETWNDLADENVYEQKGYVFEREGTAIPEADRGDISAFVGEYNNPDAKDMNSTFSISIQSDGTWSWSGNRTQTSGISYERDGTLYLLVSAAKSWSNIDTSGWNNHATQEQGRCTLQGDKLTVVWQSSAEDGDGVQEIMYRK